MLVYIRACECGSTDVTHEEHYFDETIYHTPVMRQRDGKFIPTGKPEKIRTAQRQLLLERWYCKSCGALLKEKGVGVS